jgi:hypothetical protein
MNFSKHQMGTRHAPMPTRKFDSSLLLTAVPSKRRVEEIYGTSLELNRGAFADGEYEIAYNLLQVALRCGQRLRNVEHLREVERVAENESRYLDDHHPECEYSNKVANARGNVGVFQMTAERARKLTRNLT